MGFSEVVAIDSWRASFAESVILEAEKHGIELKLSDAQRKQENQIRAVRSFIAQGVDAIIIAQGSDANNAGAWLELDATVAKSGRDK